MTTHQTLTAAQAATTTGYGHAHIVSIIEIDHATQGRCYIGSRVSMATLATKAIPDIVRMIAEYPVVHPDYVPPTPICQRCAVRVPEHSDYCTSCRRLLAVWGANADEPVEPTHKREE